jgi:hypothetical protein
VKTESAPEYQRQSPAYQQNGVQQNGVQQNGVQQNGVQQNGVQQNRVYEQQQAPDYRQPAPPDNEPGRGLFEPDRPVDKDVPVQPKPPSSASPAPEEEASPPAQQVSPSRASPAPSQ